MGKRSAGILVYRFRGGALEVFLVHPGGPFWRKRDAGVWSIPKGEFAQAEEPFEAAKREFREETGFVIEGTFIALTPLKQPSGKLVYAWAVEGECDARSIQSNTFRLEWPPRSGKYEEFPEVDRAAWLPIPEAMDKVLAGQRGLLAELLRMPPKTGNAFDRPITCQLGNL
jgi:predicted NUDIX family NTP pyrophosphohydrolase